MKFKFLDKLELTDSGHVTGAVPIAAFLGGDTESHYVHIEKGDDYSALFDFPKSTYQIISSTTGTTGGYIIPGPKLGGTGVAVDILIGSSEYNLTATLTDAATGDYIVYDLLTNKAFDDYKINEPDNKTIYLNSADYFDKVLVYRTEADEERFVNASARYTQGTDWDIEGDNITFINNDFVTGEQVTVINNPAKNIEALWCDKEWYKNWYLHLPETIELGKSSAVHITSNKVRHSYIQNEKINTLRPRLIKTNHKDLVTVSQMNPINGVTYDGTGYVFIHNDNGDHYDMNIWDIDESRGLLLLEDPIKYNLNIDYLVDKESWFPISDIDMNPLNNGGEPYIYLWLHISGNVYYSTAAKKHHLYQCGKDNSLPIVLTSDFSHIFTARTIIKEYTTVDARRRGGELLNKDYENFDIKSHTTYGYWGYEPTQLNTLLVELPDTVLENMINQFNEKGATAYAYTLPADMDESRVNIINYINTFEDLNEINLIRNEIIEAIRRYVPLGISVIVSDKHDNILFDTKKHPDLVTYSGVLS